MEFQQYAHIIAYLTDRERKGEPAYWSISYTRFGSKAQAASRKSGKDAFEIEFASVQKEFSPETIKVDIYKDANPQNRNAVLSHQFILSPISRTVSLGNIPQAEEVKRNENPFNFETVLNDKVNSLSLLFQKELEINNYKNKLEAKEKEIAQLSDEIKELEEEIEQYENFKEQVELSQKNPEKKVSLGGINIGDVLTYTAENFFKRNPKIIQNLLGLKGIEPENPEPEIQQETPQTATFKIKTPPPQNGQGVGGAENAESTEQRKEQSKETDPKRKERSKREQIIGSLTKFIESLPDQTLRQYYELCGIIQADPEKINAVFICLHLFNEAKEKNKQQSTQSTQDKKTDEQNTQTGTTNNEPENFVDDS